jgi:hypothetical protein
VRSVTSSIASKIRFCVVAGMVDLPRIEHHHPASNRREDVVHFERLNRRTFGKDGFDQGAQRGNVPLSVAELIELSADRILWGDCECAVERTVRKLDRQVGLKHEQTFTDRLDQIQGVDLWHGRLTKYDLAGAHVSLPAVLILS